MSRRPLGLRALQALGSAAVLWGLVACSDDTADLSKWMNEQRQQARANVAPPPAPLVFRPIAYSGALQHDPYDPNRLAPTEDRARDEEAAQRQLLPPLERYPVEAMVLVGTLERAGKRWAMLKMQDGLFYVGVGDRLGVHKGRVSRITENEISVLEPVKDALGNPTTRNSVLTLKETTP